MGPQSVVEGLAASPDEDGEPPSDDEDDEDDDVVPDAPSFAPSLEADDFDARVPLPELPRSFFAQPDPL